MIFLFFLHQYPGGQASESSSCVSLQVKSRGQLRFESKSIDRFLRHQYPGGQALNENMERGWLLSTSLHQKLHLLEKKEQEIYIRDSYRQRNRQWLSLLPLSEGIKMTSNGCLFVIILASYSHLVSNPFLITLTLYKALSTSAFISLV